MVKNPSSNVGDTGDAGLISGSGRSPGAGNGSPFQCSAWEVPWTEEPGGGYSPRGGKQLDTTEHACKGVGVIRDIEHLFTDLTIFMLSLEK